MLRLKSSYPARTRTDRSRVYAALFAVIFFIHSQNIIIGNIFHKRLTAGEDVSAAFSEHLQIVIYLTADFADRTKGKNSLRI